MEDIFLSIGIMVIIATACAYLGRIIKQPLIPAYIVAGILLGPVFGIITNSSVIATLSEIGIAFLLFIAGLELDLRKLKEVGVVSSIGGLIQILASFSIALVASLIMGFSQLESIYLGLIVALSSTMVVVKILSDSRTIDSLHGKIIIGILLVQDIVAIIFLSLLKSLDSFSGLFIFVSILKAAILIAFIVFCSYLIVPWLFRRAARSREMLFLTAITFLFFSSLVFSRIGEILIAVLSKAGIALSGEALKALSPGFSIAIGAFAAGVALANLPFNFQIIGQVKPLRDFFSTIFFVSLGLGLSFISMGKILVPFIILLVLVVLIKPAVVFFIASFFGYTKRTALTSGISLGQISEFSLILVSQGLILGHISSSIAAITVLLAIVSITLTAYFMEYEAPIFLRIGPYLSAFDRFAQRSSNLELPQRKGRYDAIICGYNRIGYSIGKTLMKLRKKILVVDFNPDVIRKLNEEKIPHIFGDIANEEVLERIDLKHAKIIISTVPTVTDNEMLISRAKSENNKILAIVTANQIDEALALYEKGADYVILPHFLGGKHVSMMIEDIHADVKKLFQHKISHIEELKERKRLGHEHPRHE